MRPIKFINILKYKQKIQITLWMKMKTSPTANDTMISIFTKD
jgi:hypothetical protein